MAAFLFLLVKVNLAMGAAVILVALLRRHLRLWFGAPIAYAIWLLMPIAGLASLLPPRVVTLAPVAPLPAPPVSAVGHIAHSTLRLTELAGQSALVLSVPPPTHALPDIATLLFAAWVLGMVVMALYLIRLQLRFYAAARAGQAGPAVLGFLRPRIVTPDGFQDHFTPREQAAILTHEDVHLARQDARINALAALLCCVCWFNPLIHLGARLLRVDQELACDATVVAGAISRRDYAQALLKSQLMVMSLPLGCNWPGSQHPLIARIALLKHKPPGTARRLAGISLVLLAAGFAGLSAWAAQPPVAAKLPATQQPIAALVTRPAMVAPAQIPEPAAAANPASGGNDTAATNNVRPDEAVSPAPIRAPTPRAVRIDAEMQSDLAALPQVASLSTPLNKIIPDQSPTSQDSSPEPTDSVAKSAAVAPVAGDTAAPAVASRPFAPRTEAALACLLGLGPDGCWTVFVGAEFNDNFPVGNHQILTEPVLYANAYHGGALISYCEEKYVVCERGRLETVQYLGTNLAGDDVYTAKSTHREYTYIISPPTPAGKIPALWIVRRSPTWVMWNRSLFDLKAPNLPPRTIYSAAR